MTQLLPLVITSPLHNKHDGVNIGDFFLSTSLDLNKWLYTSLLSNTISYEFITFTHTLMFRQLHTSSIDIR